MVYFCNVSMFPCGMGYGRAVVGYCNVREQLVNQFLWSVESFSTSGEAAVSVITAPESFLDLDFLTDPTSHIKWPNQCFRPRIRTSPPHTHTCATKNLINQLYD